MRRKQEVLIPWRYLLDDAYSGSLSWNLGKRGSVGSGFQFSHKLLVP